MEAKHLKRKNGVGVLAILLVMVLFLTGCGNKEKTENGSNEENNDTESKVGYYADIDGDGTVDGVIFADLVAGAQGDGQWENENGNYTISTISSNSAKRYEVSQKDYEGKFGTKDVLTPAGEGEDRFYVMALTDINPEKSYCWYQAAFYNTGAMSDYETYTSPDFGKGKENTQKMITKWNESGYGRQNQNNTYDDMWGVIQTEVENGWFVPSRAEWSAFAEELGITKSNFEDFGLSRYYWSSSQRDAYKAWYAIFPNGYMLSDDVTWNRSIRLCTTF